MDSEKRDTVTVPYYVYDGAQARAERTQKRLIIAVVILSVLLFLSNIAWLYAFTQYDYESYEVSAEGDNSNANYIGGDGDINNGGTGTGSQENKSEQQGQSDKKEA